jgi:hypothetical protein
VTPTPLKVAIEAADRAAARGAWGEALRLLLGVSAAQIAPGHDHTYPRCGEAWSHLGESCDDVAAAVPCGRCEESPNVGSDDRFASGPLDYVW